MPNSAWTETGAGIDLVPVTTPVTDAHEQSPDYLTNADKIALMAQYSAELQTKTQLDATAASLSVSSTAYDNAVAAISTGLIAAGAPSNWATIWPDGTTSGPWTDIKTSLGNWWSSVANQRTALQSSIAAQQAANAQAAAIASAATTAATLANAAGIESPSTATFASTALPSLPNGSYPAGSCWITTDAKEYQVSADGKTWRAVAFYAAAVVGQLLADQIVVANFDNLIPNPNSEQPAPEGGWPSGAYEAAGLTNAAAYAGNYCRQQNNGGWLGLTPNIPCSPGDSFYLECYAQAASGATAAANITFADKNGAYLSNNMASTTSTSWVKISATGVAPAGACFVNIAIQGSGSASNSYFDNFYFRRMADANLIVDGTITTAKIDAGGISADVIKTGTLDASVVTVTNLNASNISTGTLSASKIQFPDGSALTSSNRTKLTVSSPSSAQPIVSGSYNAVSGMSASVTIASAAELVLVSLNMSAYYSSAPGDTLFVRLMVDGNIAASFSYAITGTNTSPSKYTLATQSLVLATGTHTFDVDADSSGTGDFVDTTAALFTIHIY